MDSLKRLADWFLYSRIYADGAYRSHYSTCKLGFIYPEITAYAISLCCILYKRTKESRFLERAEVCAQYMRKISKNGAVSCPSDNFLYAFDTGIYISSMFDIYDCTEEEIYLRDSKKSLKWLYSLWNGSHFSAVDKPSMDTIWYHCDSVHLVKLAIPLLKATKCLGDEKYKDTALTLLQEYKQLQEKDGRFRLNHISAITMTHPHCYATEGYLYAYYATQNKEFLDIALKAANWLSKIQNKDGSIYRAYCPQENQKNDRIYEKLKTSDATAQATRIWKLLGINKTNIEVAYKYLDSEMNGGLRLLRKDSLAEKLFSWQKPIYSWPTFFFIHSLSLPFGEVNYTKELF